ncbi:hypothetical protein [Nonomuraea sp. NPDC046570]|uniref:hypothetical protein n=1 Tax=Nonomuraea sp. NPDC046570 TaxID=3155255 RepID=UPI00340A4392
MGASEQDPPIPDPQVRERATARRYTAAYKARILEEYDRLDKAGKGALMRREGLYSSLISSWRTARDHGAEQALARPVGRPKADPRDKKIDALEGEVERLQATPAIVRSFFQDRDLLYITRPVTELRSSSPVSP